MHPGPSVLLQATACWWASQGYCECTALCRGGRHSCHVRGWPENHQCRHYRGRCRVYMGSKTIGCKEHWNLSSIIWWSVVSFTRECAQTRALTLWFQPHHHQSTSRSEWPRWMTHPTLECHGWRPWLNNSDLPVRQRETGNGEKEMTVTQVIRVRNSLTLNGWTEKVRRPLSVTLFAFNLPVVKQLYAALLLVVM